MMHKLENPIRVKELNPARTLSRIGLFDGAFCDIGAGTGIFTFAAAKLTGGDVYAVEISEEMTKILQDKKRKLDAENVHVAGDVREVPPCSCQLVLLCTVLHELKDIPWMLQQAIRILQPGGTLAVIEFHKRQTPFGPPEARRIGPEDLQKMLQQNGFRQKEYFSLGENFYVLTAVFSD